MGEHFFSQLAREYESVTPHNTTGFTKGLCWGIYVGVAGNITGVDHEGNTILLPNVPVGTHPFRFQRINATGTAQAAGEIVALF